MVCKLRHVYCFYQRLIKMNLAVFQAYTAKKSIQCSFWGCLCIPYLTNCVAFKNHQFGSSFLMSIFLVYLKTHILKRYSNLTEKTQIHTWRRWEALSTKIFSLSLFLICSTSKDIRKCHYPAMSFLKVVSVKHWRDSCDFWRLLDTQSWFLCPPLFPIRYSCPLLLYIDEWSELLWPGKKLHTINYLFNWYGPSLFT